VFISFTFRLPAQTQSSELMPAIRRIEVREEPPLFRDVDTAAKEKEEDHTVDNLQP
jgi:hypothetical protein